MRTINVHKKRRRGYGMSAADKRNRRRSKLKVKIDKPAEAKKRVAAAPRYRSNDDDDDDDDIESCHSQSDCFSHRTDFEFKSQVGESEPLFSCHEERAKCDSKVVVEGSSKPKRSRRRIIVDSDSDSASTPNDDMKENVDASMAIPSNSKLSQPVQKRSLRRGDRIDKLLRAPRRTTSTGNPANSQGNHFASISPFRSRTPKNANIAIDEISNTSSSTIDIDSDGSNDWRPFEMDFIMSETNKEDEGNEEDGDNGDINADIHSSDCRKTGRKRIRHMRHHDVDGPPQTQNCDLEEHSVKHDHISESLHDNDNDTNDEDDENDEDSSYEPELTQQPRTKRVTPVMRKRPTRTRRKRQCVAPADDDGDLDDPGSSALGTQLPASAKPTSRRSALRKSSIPGGRSRRKRQCVTPAHENSDFNVAGTGSIDEQEQVPSNPTSQRSVSEKCEPSIAAPGTSAPVVTSEHRGEGAHKKIMAEMNSISDMIIKSQSTLTIKDKVEKVVQDYLCSTKRAEDCALSSEINDLPMDIVATSVCIMTAAFQFPKMFHSEAITLVNMCIRNHLNVSPMVGAYDLYSIDPSPPESTVRLLKNADIIQGILTMIATASDSETSNVESNMMPLLQFVHRVSQEALGDYILSPPKDKSAIESLVDLAVSLPKMHSYSLIEATLALFVKMRYALFAAIEDGPKSQESNYIQVVKSLFESIPCGLLEGIETLDPPLSKVISEKIYDQDKMCIESERNFFNWSREIIRGFGCEYQHVNSFAINGIYAPLCPENYGAQIGVFSWIDVNRNRIAFFTEPRMELDEDDTTLDSMLVQRNLISISFDDVSNSAGTLSDKHFSLSLSVSTDLLQSSGLALLQSSGGLDFSVEAPSASSKSASNEALSTEQNSYESSSCIKILIKRSEYQQFKSTLEKRGVYVSVESEGEESSSSTMASVISRISRKKNATVGTHVELNTKFGHRYPERLLDAEECILNNASTEQRRDVSNSPQNDEGSKSYDNSNDETKVSLMEYTRNPEFSHESTTFEDLAFKSLMSFDQGEQSQSPADFLTQQRLSANEITPIQSINKQVTSRVRLNYSRPRIIETLSAVWTAVDRSAFAACAGDTLETFVESREIQNIVKAVKVYDDAIVKATRAMDDLFAAQKQLNELKEISIGKEMSENIKWVADAADFVRDGKIEWDTLREINEMHLLRGLWQNLSGEK